MNQTEVIEGMLEPLYLNVSGTTLDRLRRQMTEFLSRDLPTDPGDIVMGCLTERSELSFVSKHDDLLGMMNDNELGGYIKKIEPRAMASVITLAGENYVRSNPGSRNEMAYVTPALDTVALGLLHLYHSKEGELRWREGMVPMMAIVAYTTIDKKEKSIFVALWKKASQPS